VLEAVWRGNSLWSSSSAACIPPGDAVIRSCAHLVEVETVGAPSVVQDIMYGAAGEYYSWPAHRTDAASNLYVSVSRTNPSIFAEARIAGRLAGDPPGTMSDSSLLTAGEVPHFSGRWGDYLGAAVDPADPSTVWVVGQYAKDDGFVNWGTYVGKLGQSQIGVTVRAGSDSVAPGGQVTIPVDALDVESKGAFTVEVKYDSGLLAGVSCDSDPLGVFDFGNCSPNYAPGIARCTGVSIAGVSGADLRLCDITFQADVGAPTGASTPLVANCVVKTDPSGTPILCNTEDGKITIGQGDVNCDGVVNVVDALFILQYEVGLRVDSGGCPLPPPPPDTLNAAGGDVNKDGLTNVVDALFILQCEVGMKPGANMAFCSGG